MFFRLAPRFWLLGTVAWLVSAPLSLIAQQETPAPTRERPVVEVSRLETVPEFDAFLADELSTAAATGLAKVTGFTQREPNDGAPPSARTEVFLGYTDTHFHVFARAYDPEPETIRAHLSPRDSLRSDDRITIRLDTFGDQRRAYVFATNALGVQRDASFTEGQGQDDSFEAVFQSRGRITSWGFAVSMAIPFKSLRFSPESDQDWGIVIERDRPRDVDEELTWPWVSSALAGYMDQAAVLRGVSAKTRSITYQAIPFGTFRELSVLEEDENGAERLESQGGDFDLGADLKAVFGDRLVLDATVNPDFSQVESDQPQVTVNQRFEVFFPERRPFFLENADFFETPINLVFTRRIQDPSAGLRLTGKLGKYGLGALITDDEAPGRRIRSGEGADDRAYVGIARIQRDLGAQSRLGLLYTHRDFGDDSNQVAAVDGRFRLNPRWVAEAQLARSSTKSTGEPDLQGTAFDAELRRQSRFFTIFTNLSSIDEDFDSDLGFVRRRDIREANTFMSWAFRPNGDRLVRWGPQTFVEYRTDQQGLWLDRFALVSMEAEWQNNTEVEIEYQAGQERLRPGDADGVDRLLEFDTEEWSFEVATNPSSLLEVEAEFAWAKAINFENPEGRAPELADEFSAELSIDLRPITALRINNSVFYTKLKDRPEGRDLLEDWIISSRWNWQVSLPFSVRMILQWEETSADPVLTGEDFEEELSADILLAYRFNPWTAIFLGYTQNRESLFEDRDLIDPRDRRDPRLINRLRKDGEQVFFKVSYLVW